MKKREVRMRVKQLLACALVAGTLIGVAAVCCGRHQSTAEAYHSEASWEHRIKPSPDEWEIDYQVCAYSGYYTSDEVLQMYSEGYLNIHDVAQIYVDNPTKMAPLAEYAKQSEHYDYYVENIGRATSYVAPDASSEASDVEKKTEQIDSQTYSESIDNTQKDDTNPNESNTTIVSEQAVETWDETESYEPTCTEAGGTVYMNSVTHELKTDEVPALGHDEGKWVTTVEPTFFKSGKAELRCTRDQYVLDTKTLPAKLSVKSFGNFFRKLF